MNRITQKFAELRAQDRAAFMPFVTAGDPDFDAVRALIIELERAGADLIELGIPFSDPVADGPVIQSSFGRALERGATVRKALDMIRDLRRESGIPLLTMASYSVVGRIGPEKFIAAAAGAGADGAIIPDLPVEEARETIAAARKRDFATVFLVAPTTTAARRDIIAKNATGFIYYISVAGVTGTRAQLPADLARNIEELRRLTETPIAVGFGVSTPEQAGAVARIADGVIVGSALVKLIGENLAAPRQLLLRRVADSAAALAAGVRQARGK